MKNVILYPRVSSDEQKRKGSSIPDQQERLFRYCKDNNKNVIEVFPEDYSAWYGFNRPEWGKLISFIKKNKGKIDEILFTKWDRFSRNVPEAYATIDMLRSYGVKANSIEQPLDFNIPESKIMLAVYLSVAEADNDRRSLNVRDGMRKAKDSGRYIGVAPFGYKNARDNSNKPIIIVDETKRELIKDIYSEYIKGVPVPFILKSAREKGYTVKSNGAIIRTITNHVYRGYIHVPKHRDFAEKLVKGLHEPIVTEETFWSAYYKSEEALRPQVKTVDTTLPLRGFLICAGCNHPLTGGRSKGRSKYYGYYCCNTCKKQIHSSTQVDKDVKTILNGLSLSQEAVTYLRECIEKGITEELKARSMNHSVIQKEYEALQTKINSLEKKFIEQDALDAETYKRWHHTLNKQIIEKKLILNANLNTQDIYLAKVDKYVQYFSDLYYMYQRAKDVSTKQGLMKSVFPSALIKDKTIYRTAFVPKMFERNAFNLRDILLITNEKGSATFVTLPCSTPQGSQIEPFLSIFENILKVA